MVGLLWLSIILLFCMKYVCVKVQGMINSNRKECFFFHLNVLYCLSQFTPFNLLFSLSIPITSSFLWIALFNFFSLPLSLFLSRLIIQSFHIDFFLNFLSYSTYFSQSDLKFWISQFSPPFSFVKSPVFYQTFFELFLSALLSFYLSLFLITQSILFSLLTSLYKVMFSCFF